MITRNCPARTCPSPQMPVTLMECRSTANAPSRPSLLYGSEWSRNSGWRDGANRAMSDLRAANPVLDPARRAHTAPRPRPCPSLSDNTPPPRSRTEIGFRLGMLDICRFGNGIICGSRRLAVLVRPPVTLRQQIHEAFDRSGTNVCRGQLCPCQPVVIVTHHSIAELIKPPHARLSSTA